MIKLYINDSEVDLDNTLDIKLNKKLEDIINPTVIKTTYSRNINIPITNNNNKIFSQYYRFDKMLGLNDFNANQRVPYILLDNCELLMKGYLKLNTVSDHYEVTLFDELTDKLRKMEEKTVLSSLPSCNHIINVDTIKNCWKFDPISTLDTGSTYDYVTYCPAYKGTYDNFNSGKRENADGTITELGFDVDEYDVQQFRSYYQQPCVYYNKIIKGICDSNNIRLSNDFHNDLNPYWKNTVVMFPKLINSSSQNSNFSLHQYGILNYIVNSSGVLTRYIGSNSFVTVYDPYLINNVTTLNLNNYPTAQVKINYSFKIKLKFNSTIANKTLLFLAGGSENIFFNMFRISSYFQGQTNKNNDLLFRVGKGADRLFVNTDANGDGYIQVGNENVFTLEGTAIVPTSNSTGNLKFDIDAIVNVVEEEVKNIVIREYNTSSNITGVAFNIQSETISEEISYCNLSIPEIIRSGAVVGMSNIIPSDLMQSTFLLNHIKQFGLILDKDDDGFIIKSRNTFYKEGKILNWSNKIDLSKEISIKPLAFEDRYKLLKYEPNNTSHYKNYSTLSKVPYADVRIDTSYEFNDSEKELFKSQFNTPLISQEYSQLLTLSGAWTQTGVNRRLMFLAPSMHTINSSTGVRSKAEAKMTLLFKFPCITNPEFQSDGFPDFHKSARIYLSDDTPLQVTNNEYTWNAIVAGMITPFLNSTFNNYFPNFRSITPDFKFSLEFGKNLIYYNSEVNDVVYKDEATIYNRLFKKWIEDRYSNNTKIITAYIHITLGEFKKLKLNNFIIIDNTLFLLNSVNDFNVIEEGLTKVELIKVNDINNYLKGQNIINENLTATTLSVDFTTGQLVETYDGTEDINFIVEDPKLIAISESEMYSTTIEIVDGNVIKSE